MTGKDTVPKGTGGLRPCFDEHLSAILVESHGGETFKKTFLSKLLLSDRGNVNKIGE